MRSTPNSTSLFTRKSAGGYRCRVTIPSRYERSAQRPSSRCLTGAEGHVRITGCAIVQAPPCTKVCFALSRSSWERERASTFKDRRRVIQMLGGGLSVNGVWKSNMLTMAPHLSLLFLQSIRGAKSPTWPGPAWGSAPRAHRGCVIGEVWAPGDLQPP